MDHKNMLYDKMASEQVCRWRTMLEEYGAEFVHIASEHNVIADALSRLDARWADDAYDEFNEVPELINVMEAYPITEQEVEETAFLIFLPLIKLYQQKDRTLRKLMRDAKPGTFTTREVEGKPLIHSEGKIYIPEKLQQRVVAWYHEYQAHAGETRTEATIRQHFT